jgi:pre-mRNA-splicing factor SYF1
MYSEFEEQYGLYNHAVEILDRMSDEVPENEKQRAYEAFACKVANFMGVTRTRPIYEKALENFKGKTFILFGLRYAKLEKKLGEIDRARQIFNYLAPMVDPEIDHHMFWKV